MAYYTRSMKRIATAAIALVGLFPAAAEASRYEPYLKIARQAFPSVCSPITVETAPWRGWIGVESALAYPETCRIVVAPDFASYSRLTRCNIIVHEVGHLTGIFEHSTNPRSIMYWSATGRPRQCKRFGKRFPRGVIEG